MAGKSCGGAKGSKSMPKGNYPKAPPKKTPKGK